MIGQSTSIKVPSLAGGVSRTAPTKRRPDQVEEADNVFLTLERSAEKRQGTDFVDAGGDGGSMQVTNPDDKETCFFEFVTEKDQSVIIVMVDVQPGDANYDVENLLQVFDGSDGTPVAVASLATTLDPTNTTFAAYIQAGATVPLCERIKQVRIRDFLCFLNTEVTATYKNVDEGKALEYVSPITLMGADGTTFESKELDENNNYPIQIGDTEYLFAGGDFSNTPSTQAGYRSTLVTTDMNSSLPGAVENTYYYDTTASNSYPTTRPNYERIYPINWNHSDATPDLGIPLVGLKNVGTGSTGYTGDTSGIGSGSIPAVNNPFGVDIHFNNLGANSETHGTNRGYTVGQISVLEALGYPIEDSRNGASTDEDYKIRAEYFPAGLVIPAYVESTYKERIANENTGTTYTSQDSISVPDFLSLGPAPDLPRDYDTISRGAISAFQGSWPYIRTPFVRNTDEIRYALAQLHNEPSIVPQCRWNFTIDANDGTAETPLASSFAYSDNAVTAAQDQLNREARFGVNFLCGNPADGDGFIFYVEESTAGFPAGYYRVISSPITMKDFKTTDFIIDIREEERYFASNGAETTQGSSVRTETNTLEVRRGIFPQIGNRLVEAALKESDGVTSASPFPGVSLDGFRGTPPYYQRIRTPEIGSVLDRATMPHIFAFNGNPDTPDFVVSEGPWSPRLSGDFTTNPGPSFISGSLDPLSETSPTGQKITSISYWRNRLWLASGTTIVTSRAGDPFNLWLDDINTVSDDDPIDLFLGDTDASEINWIIPFEKSCFVGTNGRTQFIISGAENFIAPSTVSIDSGNEYSVSADAQPLKVGMYLFFVDRGRLYIHAGGGSANRPNLSFSVSEQVYGYFPYICRQAIAAPASDYLLFLSGDEGEENMIYVFQQRTLPDGSIGQQSFYRWIFDAPIEHITANGDLLKILTKRTVAGVERRYLEVLDMSRVELGDVLVDRRYTIESADIVYDNVANTSTFVLPYHLGGQDYYLVDTTDFTQLVGTVETSTENANQSTIVINGDYREKAGSIVVGVPYEMKIELSKFVMRGEDNVAGDGTITLKSLGIRHYNSGTYDIGVMRQGRFETITTFDPYRTNNPFVTKEERYYDPNGQSNARLAANADRAQIQIRSNGFIPVNLTNVEAFVSVTGGRHNATE